ncbi:MAG: cation transporter [Candidatus Nanopelagicales bacterium]|jgi:cation diffusion facilitator family transporter|nr:cation transporter [Candidatus Nanopelagicales bacterium]
MTTSDAPAPSDAPARREALGLKLSAAGALVLAVVGIVWGLAVSSQVILFDGLYSVIGFVLAWFGLRAARLVQRGPTPHYPFGREALAPLVVAVQALVLLGTFGYAAIDAVGVILRGGSQTEVGPALAYAVLSLVACIAAYVVLLRMQQGSDLVAAEAVQWRASVVLGVAMTIGFTGAVALTRTAWADAAPYVDPVLVLVAAALILPAPVRMLRQSFRELLEGAPGPEVTDPIDAAVDRVRSEFGLPEPTTRMGKLGRKVYLELDFLVGATEGWTVDHADQVRRRLLTDLAEPGRLLWINVELHTDPAWDT